MRLQEMFYVSDLYQTALRPFSNVLLESLLTKTWIFNLCDYRFHLNAGKVSFVVGFGIYLFKL